jgi:hypothetical protein
MLDSMGGRQPVSTIIQTRQRRANSVSTKGAAMQKRFTYWTEDVKRHWTPIIGKCLSPAESAEFVPADTAGRLHSRSLIYKAKRKCQQPTVGVPRQQHGLSRTRT